MAIEKPSRTPDPGHHDRAVGTLLLGWLLSPVFAWMAAQGLQEGYLCGGIEREDKTRLVYVEHRRIDDLRRYDLILHPEGEPGERISMVVRKQTAEEAMETGLLAVYRTKLASPEFVQAQYWRAAQPIFDGPGGIELSWKTPLGLTFLVIQLAYFGYRSYIVGDQILRPSSGPVSAFLFEAFCLSALLGTSWLVWEDATQEGRIAMLARRDDPRTLTVEAMVERKELGIFPESIARGFLEGTGEKGWVQLYRDQFEITAEGDRLIVFFSGVDDPPFITPQNLRSRDAVWIIGGIPLYRERAYILMFLWTPVLVLIVLVFGSPGRKKQSP